ncbi:translation elongation factor 2 (EF-2/EF-G) [Ferrimonas sediminum]|uniref:Elongation factor G n=1 Tax=Ferrimonas sediminum TaxID=718193 RepID=A0A1G8XHD5_9GAMM|nr:elongation factor G [Ferrimonas sediminum]SDJ89982.1 translation elongation factor 2 (EF-2/EF-G) [Ferrimonas sediminum]
MPEYRTAQIRNLALMGHTGSGKSTLIEALLYRAHAINNRGRVDKGTNHADFTAQEQAHHHSLEPSFLSFDYHEHHINLIDTPGLADFFGRALLPLPAVESVLLVVHADRGIEAVTQRAFEHAREQGKAIVVVINHIDDHLPGLEALVEQIQTRFGHGCLPVNLPLADGSAVADCYFSPDSNTQTLFSDVASVHDELIDTVLEEDEALMELYLEQGESLSPEQLHAPLETALRQGHLVPICFTSAEQDIGLSALLKVLVEVMPNPLEATPPQFLKGWDDQEQPVTISQNPEDHVLAHVFRVGIDPFVGKMGVVRLHQGTIDTGMRLLIGDGRKPFKISHLFKLQGGKQLELKQAIPGDIFALAKIDGLEVDAILHDSHDEDHYHMPKLALPQPIFGLAVKPKRRGDEQKIADVLHKLVAEDPSLHIEHQENQNETVLQGLGDLHVQIALEKANEVFNVDMDTAKPSVAYKETITAPAEAMHRHKKQTGGAGQFGEVHLRIEPLSRGEGFQFESQVVGGAIPGQFIPAIEKGVKEAMAQGFLASFPMQDIKVVVLDGKHHAVDSKEIAFVAAGKKAFLEAVSKASPVILEPLVDMHVQVPQDKMGDITGDLSAHRAMVCGTEALDNSSVDINVEAPLAALDDYATRLKAMTGGEGQYSMTFSRYEVAPPSVQESLMH